MMEGNQIDIDIPESQESHLVKDVNLCVVCEEGETDRLVTSNLAEKLVTHLHKFWLRDLLSQDLKDRLLKNGKKNLENTLKSGKFKIHKSCYDRFNPSKLKRYTSAKKRKIEGESSRNTRSHFSPTEQFEELCMYCGKPASKDPKHADKSNPLHAAAGRKACVNYVDEFTSNVRHMATKLGDTKVLSLLGLDVRSSELYYHNICHANFRYKFEQAVEADVEDQNSVLSDFVSLSAVKDFVEESSEETFNLKDLEKIYIGKLAEHGRVIKSHMTRFAAKLSKAHNIGLTVIQQLTECGRYTAVKNETLSSNIPDSDWVQVLRKIVEPIREEIFEIHQIEKPAMSDLSGHPCPLPYNKLRLMITLLCTGKPEFQNISTALDTMCQQIILNTKKHSSTRRSCDTPSIRHSRNAECPAIQYTTVKLYSVIRCKSLMHVFFQHGITLSYSRILSFIDELSQTVKVLFGESDNKVLPSVLHQGIFTIFVDDNIDKNSSSVDAKQHFHGTAITVLQFLTSSNLGDKRYRKIFSELTDSERSIKTCVALDEFKNVNFVRNSNKAFYPLQTVNVKSFEEDLEQMKLAQLSNEDDWLKEAAQVMRDTPLPSATEPLVSWTAYHENKARDKSENITTINVPLPLIDRKSNEIELQFHIMKMAVDYTKYLIPEQVAVGCSDQPLYALKKTIQLTHPDLFGEKYFCFMGGLHIEQAAMVCAGQLLTESGMDDIAANASLDTTGLKTAVCDVNNIKKARYTLQVIAVVLMRKLQESYELAVPNYDNIEQWVAAQQDCHMFMYWYNILEYIKLILLLIRSFREASINLLIVALEGIAPFFFALDHVHYARWVSVFIQDLKTLPYKMPGLYDEFNAGKFAVNTRGNTFSRIALDQAQEHNNKKIKSTAGYIDLVNQEDKQFLQKIELCWPEVHQYLVEVEGSSKPQGHKEKSNLFIHNFRVDCNKVHEKVLTNPFCNVEFIKLNSAFLFPELIVCDTVKVFKEGPNQYEEFCRTRFTIGTHDVIKSKITKNFFKLPKDADMVHVENPRIVINDKLLNKLRDACQFRSPLARKVFQGEWTGLPESLVRKDGKPYHNSKSTILDCIVKGCLPSLPTVDALVVDLSVIIRAQAANLSSGSTFDDFSACILRNIVGTATKQDAKRIDIVADQYSQKSIKYHTRLDRKAKGFGYQIEFDGKTIVPDNMANSFLTDEANKTKLNDFIAKKCDDLSAFDWNKDFCVTNKLTNVVTNSGEKVIYTPNLMSILEEADNRIICHIYDILKSGLSRITVKTCDSDVVVILLGFMEIFIKSMPEIELFVEFNTGIHKKLMSINSSYNLLGKETCSTLLFFHSFTGADSTSSFFKLTKKEWYSHWENFPLKHDLNKVFQNLSNCPTREEVLSAQEILQKFVVYVYTKKKKIDCDLDELRFIMFQKDSSNALRNLPPSKDALLQHALRSAYQAGWVWGNSLTECIPPSPELWGWQILNDHLRIHWSSLNVHNDLLIVTNICQCRTAGCNTCKCAKNLVKCLKYCNCSRKCNNF